MQNISRYWKGKLFGKQHRKKLSDAHKGKTYCHSEKTKRKISESLKLKNNPDYDKRLEIDKIKYNSPEYIEFKLSVLERDNYICQRCGRSDRQLEAHHIKAKSLYPELTLDINNGITLCDICHCIVDQHRGYFGPVKNKQQALLVLDYDGTITTNIEYYRQLAFNFYTSGHEVHIMTACNYNRRADILASLKNMNIKYHMVHFRSKEFVSTIKNIGEWKLNMLKKIKATIFFDNEIKNYELADLDFSDLKTAVIRI